MADMPNNDAPMIEWALWLAALGYRVFPCTGKAPAIKSPHGKGSKCKGECGKWGHGFRDGTTDAEIIRAMWAHYPTSNIGIATGREEGKKEENDRKEGKKEEGRKLAVVDIDVRAGGMDSWIDLEHSYGELDATITCLTGSGGGSQHKYLWVPLHITLKSELAPGIDIKSDGGYVIAPPSLHPDTGKPYVWESDFGPDDLEPTPAPEWLLALMRADNPALGGTASTVANLNGQVSRSINEPGAEKKRNVILTRLAGAMRRVGADAQEIIAALDAHNMKWDIPLAEEELVKIAEGIEGRYAPEPQMIVTKQAVPLGQPREYAQAANDRPRQRDWWKDTQWWQYSVEPYIVNKKGKIEANNTTLIAVLKNHPDWVGRLWWDDLAGKVMLQSGETASELDDAQITRIGAEFGDKYYIAVHSDTLMARCLLAVAQENKRDPLRHYLNDLPGWDMQERLDTWLLTCGGLTDSPYHRFCSRNLIVSMIARAVDPGCICRTVLILEGPEEYRKSTFVSHLVPFSEWFDEISGSLDSKEAHMMVQGLWVAELSELDSLGRTEETRLKSFISLRVDAYIPKFKSIRVQPKRRTIFVGTTNETVYFKSTGNTRFLPVKVLQPLDIEYFLTIREQLYAEAKVYYSNNTAQWWRMDEEATLEAEEQREQRRQAAMIEDDFRDWLYIRRFAENATAIAEVLPRQWETTMREIATGYYGLLSREKWKDAALMRETQRALRALGWYPKMVRHPQKEPYRAWVCNPLEQEV